MTSTEKATHTPGPWSLHPALTEKTADQVSIAIETPRGRLSISAHGLPKKGEMLANAHLIAAAPALLEAAAAALVEMAETCEELTGNSVSCDHFGNGHCETHESMPALRAAIAAARGEA